MEIYKKFKTTTQEEAYGKITLKEKTTQFTIGLRGFGKLTGLPLSAVILVAIHVFALNDTTTLGLAAQYAMYAAILLILFTCPIINVFALGLNAPAWLISIYSIQQGYITALLFWLGIILGMFVYVILIWIYIIWQSTK